VPPAALARDAGRTRLIDFRQIRTPAVELTGMDESKQAHSIADRVSYDTTCRR